MSEQYNAAAWLIDRHVDEDRGHRVAIRCQGRSTTYAELQREMWRAQALLAALGAEPGDRIAMVVRDDETFPAIFLGAMRSGLVPVPLSTMLKGGALGEIVADSGAAILVVSAAFADVVPDLIANAPAIAHIVVSGDASLDVAPVAIHDWEAAPAAASAITSTDSSARALSRTPARSAGRTGTRSAPSTCSRWKRRRATGRPSTAPPSVRPSLFCSSAARPRAGP